MPARYPGYLPSIYLGASLKRGTMLFDELLERLPDRSIILIEEDLGTLKEIFAQRMASTAAMAGWRVRYITTGFKEEIQTEMRFHGLESMDQIEFVDRFQDRKTLAANCDGDLCIIDAITTFLLDAEAKDLVSLTDSLLDASRKGRIILMLADRGVLHPSIERFLQVRADGVIQFETCGEGEGRCMRILKMKRSRLHATMVSPIHITETGIPLLEEK